MSSKVVHKYQLYLWSLASNKYVMCVEYNTLQKIKKFYTEAKEGKLGHLCYSRRNWNSRYIVKHSDLNKYYVRHIEIKVEQTILKDEKIKESLYERSETDSKVH